MLDTARRRGTVKESWARAKELSRLTGKRPGVCRSWLATDPDALDRERAKTYGQNGHTGYETGSDKVGFDVNPDRFTIAEIGSAMRLIASIGSLDRTVNLVQQVGGLVAQEV
jgi:hypothetical protein